MNSYRSQKSVETLENHEVFIIYHCTIEIDTYVVGETYNSIKVTFS